MKRLIVSLIIMTTCFCVCLYGYIRIKNSTQEMIDNLNNAFEMIQKKEDKNDIIKSLEHCINLWNENKTTFGIFLKHDSFNQIDNLIPILKESYQTDKKHCADKLLQTISVLNSVVDQQRFNIGNLL